MYYVGKPFFLNSRNKQISRASNHIFAVSSFERKGKIPGRSGRVDPQRNTSGGGESPKVIFVSSIDFLIVIALSF